MFLNGLVFVHSPDAAGKRRAALEILHWLRAARVAPLTYRHTRFDAHLLIQYVMIM